jgi:hypothetical protein
MVVPHCWNIAILAWFHALKKRSIHVIQAFRQRAIDRPNLNKSTVAIELQ